MTQHLILAFTCIALLCVNAIFVSDTARAPVLRPTDPGNRPAGSSVFGPGIRGKQDRVATCEGQATSVASAPVWIHVSSRRFHFDEHASSSSAAIAAQSTKVLDSDLTDNVVSTLREERQHFRTLVTKLGGAVGGLGGLLLLVQLFNALWDARQRLQRRAQQNPAADESA